MEREDKSTTLPGKKDTKAIDKKAKQKHDLSGSMLNLFDKFQLEDQTILEEEKFEDTKGVIISRKSKNDRQHREHSDQKTIG